MGASTYQLPRQRIESSVDESQEPSPLSASRSTIWWSRGPQSVAPCTGEIQVPPQETRKEIIREYHTSLVDGHKGITKTFRLIRGRFV